MRPMKGKAGMKAVLVRVEGLAVDLSDPGKFPKRMKVLNWGENPNARNKRVFVGNKLVQNLQAPTYPFRTVPLDYEHNTLPGTPAYAESQEPRPVAGYSSMQVVPGQGVFILMLNWTPSGLENAANYCDLSAAAVTDEHGEVIAIPSNGLCRCGAVEGMDFKDVPLSVSDVTALSAFINTTTEGDVRELICKVLDLDPATATDAEIETGLKAMLKPDATALNAAVSAAVTEAVKPLQTQVTALSAAGDLFKTELAKRDKQAVLDGALRDGKVVALNADAVGALSLQQLQEHVKALPVTVPLSARTPAAMAPDGGAGAGPSEEQRAIALNCGMDPEAVWPGKK